jgi:hypothetical protein
MEPTQAHTASAVKATPTLADWIFILIVLAILSLVANLGHSAYLEAMHTENSKKNGEALSAWLTEAGTGRFKKAYEHPACAGGKTPVKPVEVDADGDGEPDVNTEPVPGTWGACFQHIMTSTDLKNLVNPFFNEPPKFIAACNPDDDSLMGSIVLEKMVATPPGSAVPVINSQLVETDPIDQKMQLRISVCDKGSYAIKIAEFEF